MAHLRLSGSGGAVAAVGLSAGRLQQEAAFQMGDGLGAAVALNERVSECELNSGSPLAVVGAPGEGETARGPGDNCVPTATGIGP